MRLLLGRWTVGEKFLLFLFMFMIFIPFASLHALEVDEKLPLRVLKLSQTKKTALINRGIEDGLQVGDHAKFFLTTGVVARAVVIKTSPTRSVWSVYRIVKDGDLTQEKVMNLKITPAVKLTNDPTKRMLEHDEKLKMGEGILLAEGAGDMDEGSERDKKDKKALEKMKETTLGASLVTNRVWEIWGLIHINTLSSTNTTGTSVEGTSGTESTLNFLVGLEKYFLNYNKWYSNVSVSPFFHYEKKQAISLIGQTIDSTIVAGGIGGSWHFKHLPQTLERIIYFANVNVGLGVAQNTSMSSATSDLITYDKGGVTFFSVGGGIKYTTSYHLGFKVLLDYYYRNESFDIQNEIDPYTRVVNGPRLLFGLAYRF